MDWLEILIVYSNLTNTTLREILLETDIVTVEKKCHKIIDDN